jgi:nicotinamidase-related amidase
VKRILCAILLTSLAFANPVGLTAQPEIAGQEATVELPAIPAPVAVELDPAKTAFLILDLVESICNPRPGCPESIAPVSRLLTRARAANVPVVYSNVTTPSPVMAGLEPLGHEPMVASTAEKYFRTDLEDILTGMGVDTLIIVGSAANGAVLYTNFASNTRGFTTVVAEDGISATTPFDVFLTRYQILNQPGPGNPQNSPLMAGRPTLSRTDMITFR